MAFLVLLGQCMQHRGAARCSITVQSAAAWCAAWFSNGCREVWDNQSPHPQPTGGWGDSRMSNKGFHHFSIDPPQPHPTGGWGEHKHPWEGGDHRAWNIYYNTCNLFAHVYMSLATPCVHVLTSACHDCAFDTIGNFMFRKMACDDRTESFYEFR